MVILLLHYRVRVVQRDRKERPRGFGRYRERVSTSYIYIYIFVVRLQTRKQFEYLVKYLGLQVNNKNTSLKYRNLLLLLLHTATVML